MILRFPLFRRRRDRELEERREADRLVRGATCIPTSDAVVCGNDHIFNGRFTEWCPCGSRYAFAIEPTGIRDRLAEAREVRA